MSVPVAATPDCPQEIPVVRTAHKKPVEESFGERLARLRKARGSPRPSSARS